MKKIVVLHNIVLITFVLGMGAMAANFYYEGQVKAFLHEIQLLKYDNARIGQAIQQFDKTTSAEPKFDAPLRKPPSLPETSVEFSDIKIKFTEGSSWTTVFKIMTTILGTFLGIKLINTSFRWIDPDSVPFQQKSRQRRG